MQTPALKIWRDSVCAGDDGDAPHELVLHVHDGETLRAVVGRLLAARYLASINSGQATWVLQNGHRSARPLAVIAQQWPQARFLVDADAALSAYLRPEDVPHLHFRYCCQIDPEQTFECLQRGEPLPA